MSVPNETPNETFRLPGLDREVEILVDRHGIPHLYAQGEADLFFAQGFNAGRDRLWQLDLWRKRGRGLMAADFGPSYADRDRAARLFLYRGDLDAEFACYGPKARAWTESFVAGLNAWITLVEREPARLPVEFRLAGTRPARWSPEDVVRCRAHAWVTNAPTEIQRNDLVARFGLDAAALAKELEPAWTLKLPEGWVNEPVPPQVLQTFLQATDPNPLGNQGAGVALDDAAARAAMDAASGASNNWAIRAERTATGRPILASDPHRVYEQPGLRYTAHLVAPGIDVIGAGEAAIPGVSLGHNQRVAFSLTIHPADQTDLYVYEIDPADPLRYRYGDGWERMREVVETLSVKGEPDRELRLLFTRHGPVAHVDASRRRAYAFRSAWTEPGTAAYMASLRYLTAGSAAEYVETLEHWGAPTTNHVVADVDGHIAWQAAGLVPLRPTWDGLLPVPGDGRHEWAGFTRAPQMPGLTDPPAGWVGTSNQMNLPADYDVATRKTGFEFPDPSRYRRLAEAMSEDRRWTLADTMALQADVLSIPARRLCALLAAMPWQTRLQVNNQQASPALEVPPADGWPWRPGHIDETTVGRALDLFVGWNHRLDRDSAAAALFETWLSRHLMPGVLKALGPEGFAAAVALPDPTLIVNLLDRADPTFGRAPFAQGGLESSSAIAGSPVVARDVLMLRTLADAWADVTRLLGSDPKRWAWGKLLHAFFEHPLSRHASPELAARLNVGPGPKGGAGMTLNAATYFAASFRIHYGVSWRMVADVGDWDRSVTINPPGQSGDPDSPHYRDHFALWINEQYVPMLYTRAAVEGATERRIVLTPA